MGHKCVWYPISTCFMHGYNNEVTDSGGNGFLLHLYETGIHI